MRHPSYRNFDRSSLGNQGVYLGLVAGRRHAAAMLTRASFTEDTANRTGKSQRSIQRAIQRAAQNGPTTLTRVARTALDTGAELDALPLLPHATQELLIEQAAAGAEVSAVQARREMRESSAAEGPDATNASSPPDSTEAESDFPGLSALKKAWLAALDQCGESAQEPSSVDSMKSGHLRRFGRFNRRRRTIHSDLLLPARTRVLESERKDPIYPRLWG
jgi:hypothetical protein